MGVKAKVEGWIDLKLIDRSGKVIFEHQQSNLILDKGIIYAAQNRDFANLHTYIAVGTGSTAPNASQTALVSEVARTNLTLNLGPDSEVIVNGDGDYTIRRTRGFDYNQANGNLTEFGGSNSSSSSAGVNTRELFRDADGNPIVITKTSNERLAITYSLRIIITPVTLTDYGTLEFKDNNNNVVATRLVKHTFTRHTITTRGIDLSIFAKNAYTDSGGSVVLGGSYDVVLAYLSSYPNTSYLGSSPEVGSSNANAMTFSYVGFSSGQGTFGLSNELGPEASDRTIYGVVLGTMPTYNPGRSYIAVFTNPDGTANPFIKNKDYRLRMIFRFSISR